MGHGVDVLPFPDTPVPDYHVLQRLQGPGPVDWQLMPPPSKCLHGH